MDVKMLDKETGELVNVYKDFEALQNLREQFMIVEEKIKEKEKEQGYKRGMRREIQCIDDGIGIEKLFLLDEKMKEKMKENM